jgi:hypothetical protein
MSWDIFAYDFPRDAKSLEDLPAGFKPPSLGERSSVIAKIREVVPDVNFSNPAWGRIDRDGFSIELNMGRGEVCDGFAFHVRGGAGAVAVVAAILNHLDLRAVDAQTGGFFVAGQASVESFRKWQAYRDQVAAGVARKGPSPQPGDGVRRSFISVLRFRIANLLSRWGRTNT